MAILKLRNGKHNAISATISAVEHVPTKNPKYKDQYRFTLHTGDDIYTDEGATDRQVERLKLAGVLDLVGKEVTFWKRAMDGEGEDGKGYLNIEMGNTATRTPGVGAALVTEDYVGRDLRAAGVAIKPTTYEEIVEKYTRSLASAVAITDELAAATGKEFTPEAVTSVAATLFIESNKRGV